MSLPNPYWEKRFLRERVDFIASYKALPDEYQKHVDKFLTDVLYDRQPWTTYACSFTDCHKSRKNMYLCNASYDAEGARFAQVAVWFNPKRRWMVPLNCEFV